MNLDNKTLLLLVAAFTTILLLLTAVFVYVVYLFRNRKGEEYSAENIRLMEWNKSMVSEHERYLKELSTRFHNKVQQQTLHIKHMFGMARKQYGKSPATDFDEISELLDELFDDASQLTSSMNLEYLRSQSLVNLIERELEEAKRLDNIDYELDFADEPHLTEDVKIIVYRIAQEAIANIHKHAMASFIIVSMLHSNGKFILSIEDNGSGLNREQIYGAVTHGITNMRNRAAIINARFDISSEERNGTKITLQMTV
ncbi:sensor histidine kinase [Pedobacter insulae]|uniref:histidine kinase n=1 Tax=Pedobacter insulae TaxID=414048 RepID=A0A1I2ZIS4_9SPHI|nr:ATP-binding protein [Pedobacter insulae]SFH37757.1 hypothetical protein SAMN04489864_11062 [Pedobacter insulae]